MYPWIQLGSLRLPTYYLIISVACTLGSIWLVRRARKFELPLLPVLDLALITMIFGFIGGRLGHVLIEEPHFYLQHPTNILAFWNGGFVFYGGALLAMLACFVWSKVRNPPTRLRDGYLDCFAPVLGFVYSLGRIACFLEGCCYGRACSLPWAVVFPRGSEAPAELPLHPTQLYAVIGEWMVIAIVLLFERALRRRRPGRYSQLQGRVFALYVGLHAASRIVMELYRADDRGWLIEGWISPAILISLILILMSGTFLIQTSAASGRSST